MHGQAFSMCLTLKCQRKLVERMMKVMIGQGAPSNVGSARTSGKQPHPSLEGLREERVPP